MAEERIQRRLAAILAADMVGYSRLMEADETGIISRQKAYRFEVIDPEIAAHGGRIVKTTGDGMLVEFPSVVEATECAVAIQRAMVQRETEVGEERRIQYRIGINLGDIVIDGDDILGDGVNVAARLEGLSEPGGICISDVVHQSVAGKLDLAFEDLGQQQVKNITKPVHAYQIILARVQAAPKTEGSAQADRPSIAVLPFDNLSGDPEQEYFADGMVEEIITGLSAIRWLTVIARNSSFFYKGKSVDIRQVSRELGVRYVLEGSVRKAGNRVRITTQLIEADQGGHIWADRFDGSLEDIFDLQDQITAGVVGAIEPSVRKAEIERAKRKRPDDLNAYDLYLRAMSHMHEVTAEGRIAALDLIEQALQINPNYAEAHGVAAWCYFARALWEGSPSEDYRDKAIFHARAVQNLQTEDASTLAHAAMALAVATRDFDSALDMIERAIATNPSSVHAHGHGAVINTFAGNYQTAIRLADRSLALSPFDPLSVMPLAATAGARLMLHEFEESLTVARRALQVYPTHAPSHLISIASLVRLDRLNDAKAAADRLMEIWPNFRLDERQSSPVLSEYLDELRLAGIPS
jgi:adenylate cyclase